MKWTNGELVEIYENAYDNIQLAIDELNEVDEYKEILETLKEAKSKLEETVEKYMQAFNRECDRELKCQNSEYERSVL
jgi:formiminotetrahydrofolate cyclodeaminase